MTERVRAPPTRPLRERGVSLPGRGIEHEPNTGDRRVLSVRVLDGRPDTGGAVPAMAEVVTFGPTGGAPHEGPLDVTRPGGV